MGERAIRARSEALTVLMLVERDPVLARLYRGERGRPKEAALVLNYFTSAADAAEAAERCGEDPRAVLLHAIGRLTVLLEEHARVALDQLRIAAPDPVRTGNVFLVLAPHDRAFSSWVSQEGTRKEHPRGGGALLRHVGKLDHLRGLDPAGVHIIYLPAWERSEIAAEAELRPLLQDLVRRGATEERTWER